MLTGGSYDMQTAFELVRDTVSISNERRDGWASLTRTTTPKLKKNWFELYVGGDHIINI